MKLSLCLIGLTSLVAVAAPVKDRLAEFQLAPLASDCESDLKSKTSEELKTALLEQVSSLEGIRSPIGLTVDLSKPESPCLVTSRSLRGLALQRLKGELFLNPLSLEILKAMALQQNTTSLEIEIVPKARVAPVAQTTSVPQAQATEWRPTNTMPVITDEMVVEMRRTGSSCRRSSYASTRCVCR